MTTPLDYLATVCVNIIKAQNLNKLDEFSVGAKILGKLAGDKSFSEETAAGSTRGGVAGGSSEVVEEAKPPKPTKVKPRKLASAGGDCSCILCNAKAYRRVTDVYDQMKVSDFITAFEPIGKAPQLTSSSQIRTIGGVTTTDCPLCGGEQSLQLIGGV